MNMPQRPVSHGPLSLQKNAAFAKNAAKAARLGTCRRRVAASGADRVVLYFHDEWKYHWATANFLVGEVSQSLFDLFLHHLLRRALFDGLANHFLRAFDQVFVLAHVNETAADDLR